jgi:hypothetical protein
MPKVSPRLDAAQEYRQAQWELFERDWTSSKKGNLWKLWDGKTVSIFKRTDGWWGWSYAAKNDRPRFSTGGYKTIEEAMEGLADVLAVGLD